MGQDAEDRKNKKRLITAGLRRRRDESYVSVGRAIPSRQTGAGSRMRPIVEKQPRSLSSCSRRAFLAGIGAGLGGVSPFVANASASVSALPVSLEGAQREAADSGAGATARRREEAFRTRLDAALYQKNLPQPPLSDNGEESDYPYVANYSKGLPHNGLGEVDRAAYRSLLDALSADEDAAFERIPLGGVRPLRNPQGGKAFDIEGPDCHHLAIRPAPRIDQPESSSEMAELYWMALARDMSFTEYESNAIVVSACTDLSKFSDFRGPKQSGLVTPATIFRGNTRGDQMGPYVSQFLLKDIPYGTLRISQKQQSVIPNMDYMTDSASWLNIQNGLAPFASDVFDRPRYIGNGRDLATYVHFDALYEAYLNACLILLGLGAPFDRRNPYLSLNKTDGFATFGGPHILSLVTEVATRALKAVWFAKWYVHRRLRPEEYGGRVHYNLTGARNYPIDSEILKSQAVQRIFSRFGTYLLPQAYPEGCPLHPSYGSGHATVAGACVSILKAWFDESFVLPDPVVASADGSALLPYSGRDAGSLTVGGELNKLAANIPAGRNFAGIHWRTDFSEAFKLGEAVAIGILEDQKKTYKESFDGFSLTKFDGTTITV